MANLLLPSPATHPELFKDRSGHVVGASVALIALPTVTVFLRLLSRWMARAGYWWDDYTVVLALILAWGPSIVNLVSVHHGFGKHIRALPVDTVFVWFKMLYSFEFLYTLAMASVKYSIILFQYRIFPVQQFRRMLMVALAFVIALTVACILVSIFQCVPIHDFWDTLGGALSEEVGGRCVKIELYFLIAGSINTVMDFALLALPIPILWRLRTGRPQKILLTGIFVMGLIVCVVSIVRLVVLSNVNDDDITWNYVPVSIWTAAEPSIAVVSACLPSLRPLFVRVVWHGTHRPKPVYHSGSWRGKQERSSNSFNRLKDSADKIPGSPQWRNNVAVYGGVDAGSDEYDMGSPHGDTPLNRIRAKTTVVLTISERVDWKDDLF